MVTTVVVPELFGVVSVLWLGSSSLFLLVTDVDPTVPEVGPAVTKGVTGKERGVPDADKIGSFLSF